MASPSATSTASSRGGLSLGRRPLAERLGRYRRGLTDPAFADRPVPSLARPWSLVCPAHVSPAVRRAVGESPTQSRRGAGRRTPSRAMPPRQRRLLDAARHGEPGASGPLEKRVRADLGGVVLPRPGHPGPLRRLGRREPPGAGVPLDGLGQLGAQPRIGGRIETRFAVSCALVSNACETAAASAGYARLEVAEGPAVLAEADVPHARAWPSPSSSGDSAP